ncbi:MFS transporter [Spirillospora sp. CA-294931]|uniref:MFS transporter n=1 Tax=Spirillospora sp. CA-294931 TaxID=3240042 RepID=UPI003D904820
MLASSVRAPASSAGHTLLTVSLAAVLLTLDMTIVNVALPEIAGEFSARLDGLQWVVNGYPLAFAALLLTAGSISDRIGRRTIFAVGTVVFTLASAACGLAWNPASLTVFRLVQGAGGALIMATALALIAGAYPAGAARQKAIGIFSALGGAAAGLGPLVGGAAVDLLGWRWIFWINLPVGALVLAGALRLREPEGRERLGGGLDLAGVALAVAMLFSLNYGLLTGPADGWTSPLVVTTLVAGVVLLGAFLWVEHGRRDAMLDLALFRVRTFSGAILLTFAARVTSFGFLPFLILWLQGMLGFSAWETGVRLLAMTLPILVVAPLTAPLQRRFPVSGIMASGFALIAVAFLLMARVGPGSSWTVALPGLLLLGIGGALCFPPLMGLAVGVVPPERAGMASGLSNTFFPLGTAAGVAGFGALFSGRIGAELSDARLAAHGLDAAAADRARTAVTAGRFDALPSDPVRDLARTAFTETLAQTCLVAAVAALAAVLAALFLIRARDLHKDA